MVENLFSWFTDNPWVLLITTIGLLIMTGLAVFEGIKIFRDHHNRPRIKLKAIKQYEDTKEAKKLTFWIYAHNIGKGFLSQCKVRIRITDHSGNIDLIDKTGKKYQEEFIPLFWDDENGTHNSQDLYPAKNEYGKFKLPLIVTFSPNGKEEDFISEGGFGLEFTDPVKISWKNPKKHLKGIGKIVTFYAVFSISINSMEKSFKKNFRVVIPINAVVLKNKFILFEEKKLSTFFADGLFSFISFFRKDTEDE